MSRDFFLARPTIFLSILISAIVQVEENLMANLDPLQSEHLTRESLHLTFKFLAGLMGEGAATLFRFRYLSHFDLSMINLFELLHEAGATPDNVRAISSILRRRVRPGSGISLVFLPIVSNCELKFTR